MQEFHEFSIRIQLESKGNWSGAAQARILLISIRIQLQNKGI